MKPLKLIAIDIGGGTQDILLYDDEKTIENCYKLVLPSQTVIVANQVRKATEEGKDICLTGYLMGGGPCVGAIMNHLKHGLRVYSFPEPAKTIKDNLEIVKEKGIQIVEEIPQGTVEIEMRDVDLVGLEEALSKFGVTLPENVAIALQDHGESLDISNRVFRFQHWENFIKKGGNVEDLTYIDPPEYFTRMGATKKTIPGAIFMDTGSAAIRGALLDEEVRKHREKGLVVLNIGNQHTVALLVKGNKVYGLFEHHTRFIDEIKLKTFISQLQKGTLQNETIFNDNGHGALIHDSYLKEEPFEFVTVTGPNRILAANLGFHEAVPYGDMMIAGCFGLVEGVNDLIKKGFGFSTSNYYKA